MKNFITISIMFILYSCSTDENTFSDSISNLEINHLNVIDSNIPEDFYDDLTFTNETTGYAVFKNWKNY